MVTSLLNQKPARESGYQEVQYIATRIQAVAGGTTVLRTVGVLPAGCLVAFVLSKVATAFNGGTPNLTLGTRTDPGNDDFVAAMAETAGSELLQPLGTFAQPLAVDTEIVASIAGGATAGDAYVAIAFIKPLC